MNFLVVKIDAGVVSFVLRKMDYGRMSVKSVSGNFDGTAIRV